MKHHGKRIALASLLMVMSCSVAWAQTTASVSGAVKDPSGAVLPGADRERSEEAAQLAATAFIQSVITSWVGVDVVKPVQ